MKSVTYGQVSGQPSADASRARTDCAGALAFTNRVGALAEREGHHPALLTEWGRVTVTWWTHKIRGLHRNDFIMAAKTDALVAESGHVTRSEIPEGRAP